MSALFASGHIIDAILVLTVLEAIGLTVFHRTTGRGVPPGDFLVNLASGCCLLLALRLALTGEPWVWIAAALLGSLLAHVVDLTRRWHSTGSMGLCLKSRHGNAVGRIR